MDSKNLGRNSKCAVEVFFEFEHLCDVARRDESSALQTRETRELSDAFLEFDVVWAVIKILPMLVDHFDHGQAVANCRQAKAPIDSMIDVDRADLGILQGLLSRCQDLNFRDLWMADELEDR